MGLLDGRGGRVRDRLRRWLGAGRGKRDRPALTADSPDLTVVVAAFDPAEPVSAALARSGDWNAGEPAVLRHHLRLPEGEIEHARSVLAQDGWELTLAGPGNELITLHATRVQGLDALHCAQESSRMAGLAQRLGGESPGWDALQPRPHG